MKRFRWIAITPLLHILTITPTFAQKTDRFMGETVNYDEAAVPSYTLPNVLLKANGQLVKNKKDWEKERRPEIVNLFKANVYGQTPIDLDSATYVLTNKVADAMGGKACLKEVAIHIWNKGKQVTVPLVLFVPNNMRKPAPVFLLINNRSKRNTDPTRAVKSTFWPAELLIEKGYAIAAFQVGDAAPDKKDAYQHGVLDQLFPELLTQEDGMKAIGAWAWTASRVMDYFETDKDVDAHKVALVGHSRGGKTSLWAGALDQRFALIFSSCSGSTGASLARRRYGETVSLINKQFGYWFANTYKQYSDRVDDLPVDQHMLIALLAPRPVYTTNATEDRWADPPGSYLSLVNALPVYKLYQRLVNIPTEPPPVNTPIINSFIGYHFRTGIHDLNLYDWENFVRFADHHFGR
ncbi:acetylxylan esterase [Mucilaginibacter daejeonensis]|uniref:alpha/beta hydrolase family protein n=1 Tax=Mucilaginibacter daejeonensis TaxID=398049 RepID=UPI001D176201|nr:alpha/beta hydrolase [Mucilaginibacter daejeonensis]UEG51655.1 acetylxylan esterase [Mucilaginibacter daejeonensis]